MRRQLLAVALIAAPLAAPLAACGAPTDSCQAERIDVTLPAMGDASFSYFPGPPSCT